MPRFAALFSILAIVGLCLPARAQTSYPMLMGVRPAAVQIGQTSEVEVFSRYNLADAYQVLVTGEGVTGEVVPVETPAGEAPKPAESIKVRFTVSPDASPGVRDFRLATPVGATTLGQLVLVRDPVVAETGENDSPEGAQELALPAAVCGAIEKGVDRDFYKFQAAAGTALSFHVRSARLEDKLHDFQAHSDPILTLTNSAGTVLAQADNYFFSFADPVLSYRFPADGEYRIEVRDLRYQGNAHWHYSLEINDRPLVTNAFPLAVTPGVETQLALVGFQLPAEPLALLTLPSDAADGPHWVTPALAGPLPTPVPVYASRLPLAVEAAAENDQPAAAQPIAVPCGVNGRIERESDLDCYAFEAKAGERFTFEVRARRYQSAFDPALRIAGADGATLAEADDHSNGRFASKDPLLENWAAPADGRYVAELRDLDLGGGPAYVYCLEVTRSQPYFRMELDTDKTLLAPGTAGAIFARVYRQNGFAGEVQLAIDGLPPGVTASCGRILADGTDGSIILQAASDAPRGAANVRVTGAAVHAAEGAAPLALAAVARPLQEVYSPGGGRTHFPVELHTVSVGDTADIKSVKLSTSSLTLKPGESQRIDITIERREGFDKNVTLDCVFQHLGTRFGDSLPKGVSLDENASKTLLTGGESQGHLTLKAAPDAPPVERQQVSLMANVSINFVMKMTYSSEPVFVTVAAP